MPSRRDAIIGLLGASAFGTVELLRPRTRLRLFPPGRLEDIIPLSFGVWTELPGGNIIAPTTPNSLADRLYSATVSRLYISNRYRMPPVMLLVAYGGEQSDLLQLHRPETCYPAVGLEITARELGQIPMPGATMLPATMLTAESTGRRENIVYWTRLGEEFPRSSGEQRRDRLKTAMAGIIGDGILVRASTIQTTTTAADFTYLKRFFYDLVEGLSPAARRGFIGTERAARIA